MSDTDDIFIIPDCQPTDFASGDIVLADNETVLSRLSECYKCDEFIGESSLCRQSGCPIPTKVKVNTSTCPMGVW